MHALPEKGAKRDKAAMLRAARKKWPQIEISSDDEADALWLLDLVQKELGYDTGYSRQDGRLRPK